MDGILLCGSFLFWFGDQPLTVFTPIGMLLLLQPPAKLNVDGNSFTGSLPSEIFSLPQLGESKWILESVVWDAMSAMSDGMLTKCLFYCPVTWSIIVDGRQPLVRHPSIRNRLGYFSWWVVLDGDGHSGIQGIDTHRCVLYLLSTDLPLDIRTSSLSIPLMQPRSCIHVQCH